MPDKLEPCKYMIHERFYVNNLEDVPRSTHDARCHIYCDIIYKARGPVIKLFNVYTMFGTAEDALQKIADSLNPGKKDQYTLAAKFALVPNNLSSQRMIRTERPLKLQHMEFKYMDIPSPCLTLYEMPPDYSMPNPATSACIVDTDIHKHCTNLAKIVYYRKYKQQIRVLIIYSLLGDIILNNYSMIWDPLYKWVQEYRSLFYFLMQYEFIKVGHGQPYLTRQQMIDKYICVTGYKPKWYHRMFPNRFMAPICQQAEIRDRYRELKQHCNTRTNEPMHHVQTSFV